MHSLVEVESESQFNEEVSSEEVLVWFSSPWCVPCRAIRPVLESIDREIVKVDIDKHPEIAQHYRVLSIPTIIKFNNGEEKDRVIGVKTKKNIEDALGL